MYVNNITNTFGKKNVGLSSPVATEACVASVQLNTEYP